MLKRINRNSVDDQLWNACIDRASNSLPYAYTWYLDAVAENWAGLVWGNYEAVMPLCWISRYGVKAMYQPHYCQQGGVFGPDDIVRKSRADFLQKAAASFLYVNVNVNAATGTESGLPSKANMVLALDRDFSHLHRGFSDNCKRNIAKATKQSLVFSEAMNSAEFSAFYISHNREREKLNAKHLKAFHRLTEILLQNGHGTIYAMHTPEKNWLAAVLVMKHQQRIIGLINTSSPEAKKNGGAHLLYARIIEKYSNNPLLFDFEGSSVPGVARFYQGFGARTEFFYHFQAGLIHKVSQPFRT